jgi:DNA-3-methyladenine glycosylase I
MSNYCTTAPNHPVHASYHDTEYGFPVADERALFERMALEIMQAGLSWEIVLKKRQGLNKAFDKFAVKKVAAYGEKDVVRLLADENIIRNRLKIHAIIHNANVLLEIRKSHKSFAAWIAAHHPLTKDQWVKLFRKQFKFMGGEIVGEFLMSIGYLPNAHRETCPVHKKILREKPAWIKV